MIEDVKSVLVVLLTVKVVDLITHLLAPNVLLSQITVPARTQQVIAYLVSQDILPIQRTQGAVLTHHATQVVHVPSALTDISSQVENVQLALKTQTVRLVIVQQAVFV